MKFIMSSFISLFLSFTSYAVKPSDREIAIEVLNSAQSALQSFEEVAGGKTIGSVCFKAAWADGSLGNMLFIHNAYDARSFLAANPTYLEIRKEVLKRVIENKNICESENEDSMALVRTNSAEVVNSLKTLIQSMTKFIFNYSGD